MLRLPFPGAVIPKRVHAVPYFLANRYFDMNTKNAVCVPNPAFFLPG